MIGPPTRHYGVFRSRHGCCILLQDDHPLRLLDIGDSGIRLFGTCGRSLLGGEPVCGAETIDSMVTGQSKEPWQVQETAFPSDDSVEEQAASSFGMRFWRLRPTTLNPGNSLSTTRQFTSSATNLDGLMLLTPTSVNCTSQHRMCRGESYSRRRTIRVRNEHRSRSTRRIRYRGNRKASTERDTPKSFRYLQRNHREAHQSQCLSRPTDPRGSSQ